MEKMITLRSINKCKSGASSVAIRFLSKVKESVDFTVARKMLKDYSLFNRFELAVEYISCIVNKSTMSSDWQIGSISLVESLADSFGDHKITIEELASIKRVYNIIIDKALQNVIEGKVIFEFMIYTDLSQVQTIYLKEGISKSEMIEKYIDTLYKFLEYNEFLGISFEEDVLGSNLCIHFKDSFPDLR